MQSMDGNETSVLLSAPSHLQYFYYDVWQDHMQDPRINELPLMSGGPWLVLSVIAFYVYFVKVMGPEWMQNKQPYNIKSLILAYNVFMVITNLFFFLVTIKRTNWGINTWICNPISKYEQEKDWMFYCYIGWLFVISKFIDLFDTVFFILRKNFHQVSALHVIHHALVPINCWLGLKYVASESAAFMPFINSFVHSVMYAYYALSALGPHMKKYLWWKKYLTSLQIIQLALVTIHCVYLGLNPSCNLPKFFFLVGIPQVLLILYMFVNFFVKSYSTNGSSSSKSCANGNGQAITHSVSKVKDS